MSVREVSVGGFTSCRDGGMVGIADTGLRNPAVICSSERYKEVVTTVLYNGIARLGGS